MSDTLSGCAATLDRFGHAVEQIDGVDVLHLPPFTTLLIRTLNSVYRMVITGGGEVCLQGGVFFPEPTSACLEGASVGGSIVRAGWIGVGMRVEIRSAGQRISTSPVRTITTVPASTPSCTGSPSGSTPEPCTG
ncbi:MAG TPA: hypothetical protein VJ813_18585 [Vicinamibacterales bacterium]|nr:hypothetical protein [Vicinamibacterales bacterium]